MNLKELARDIIALGGVPFVALVLARIIILEDWVYFSKIFFAVVILIAVVIFTKSNLHAGLAMIVLIFLSIHYNHLPFAIFASLIYVSMLASLVYLKEDKWKVFWGVLLGAAASLVSWVLVSSYI
ncbi:MAG: hypothetical protein OEL87_03830 [Nanoarchaeota archaeon]|nr:hypothetical protein [Nanoarchaeota archaeon]